MENPFFFGKTVTGGCFINRQREIRELSESLARGQSLIIFSPRRYGKTSLIKQVMGRLKERGLLIFYFDLYRITDLDQFYRYYTRTIVSSLQSPAQKLFAIMRALIPSLKPKLVYTEPGAPSIEVEVGLETLRKTSSLQELFDAVEKFCIKKRKKACVVFDEFQEITAIEQGDAIEREMRASFQHHQYVSYAFLGSRYHLMHELFNDKNRPFYHFGAHYELDVISQSDWLPFIRHKFAAGGYEIGDQECRDIMEITRGHPYYTQLFCSTIWDLAQKHGKIASDDIKGGLRIVLEKESHAFHELWDCLRSDERRLLSAIAKEPQSPAIFSNDFISRHQMGSASSLQRVVSRLQQRGLLMRKKQGYLITDPVFLRWIID